MLGKGGRRCEKHVGVDLEAWLKHLPAWPGAGWASALQQGLQVN